MTRPAHDPATLRMVRDEMPSPRLGAVCGQQLRAPPHAGRTAEGGLRVNGNYKLRDPATPLVSIITVVRNAAPTIAQCMDSVLAQNYANIEYIVIDGASSDGTVAIIERYAGVVDYYVSQPDDGIYAAMNLGLSLASGDYVMLLNADDWYRADSVALLVAAARASGADVCHADATLIDARGRACGRMNGWLHDGLYTSRCPLRHETMLVHHTVYERFGGYDDSYAIIADFAFIMAIHAGGCSFQHVRETLLNFRMTGISNSAQAQLEHERGRLFSAQFPFLDDADLAVLNRPRIGNHERLALLDKHRGRDERFTRSLAYAIALAPERRIAERLIAARLRLSRTFLWRWSAPLRRALNRTVEHDD